MTDEEILADKVASIKTMKRPDLESLWQELYFKAAPKMHPNLLRMRLIWRVQEIIHGGLSQAANQELKKLRKRLRNGRITTHTKNQLPIGTRLQREFNGELHEVLVIRGGFEYQGEVYKSLSKVAYRITGTRWSGPTFFGLRKKNSGRS